AWGARLPSDSVVCPWRFVRSRSAPAPSRSIVAIRLPIAAIRQRIATHRRPSWCNGPNANVWPARDVRLGARRLREWAGAATAVPASADGRQDGGAYESTAVLDEAA